MPTFRSAWPQVTGHPRHLLRYERTCGSGPPRHHYSTSFSMMRKRGSGAKSRFLFWGEGVEFFGFFVEFLELGDIKNFEEISSRGDLFRDLSTDSDHNRPI